MQESQIGTQEKNVCLNISDILAFTSFFQLITVISLTPLPSVLLHPYTYYFASLVFFLLVLA